MWPTANLHDAIPVVTRCYSEQSKESHSKVLEVSVFPEPLTWVLLITLWKGEERGIYLLTHSYKYIIQWVSVSISSCLNAQLSSPSLPNSSTPRAAKMKNSKKNSRPRLPTCGRACMTVSSSARIPFAIFSSLSTVGTLREELNLSYEVANDTVPWEIMIQANGSLIVANDY